ncbi:MAG: polysaccharide deacetylase family protein [Planctomyces sp.]|nr:polysaccharide deacetylase family protein [Planctomyces sp.]
MSECLCLMYHNVCPAAAIDSPHGPLAGLSRSIASYTVTTEAFSEQMALAAGNGWLDPAELDDAPPAAAAAATSPPRVLVTFDDGWAGSVDEAGPVLEQHGARGVLFVTTGLIGHPLFLSPGALRRLPMERYEIGGHTVSHPFLAELDDREIQRELQQSKATLEDILGREIRSLSVPNGSIDGRVRRIAGELGYRAIYTSEVRLNAVGRVRDGIGRVAVRRTTPRATFQQWLEGRLGGAGWRRRLLSVPRRLLGGACYRRLRACVLGERGTQNEMLDLMRGAHGVAAPPQAARVVDAATGSPPPPPRTRAAEPVSSTH